MLEERSHLSRHAGGQQHPHVAHRQRDVVRRARQARLTHRHGAIAVLVESRHDLAQPDAPRAGHDAQIARAAPIGARAASSSSVRHRPMSGAAQRSFAHPAPPCSSPMACPGTRRARRLVGIPLEKPVDHEPAEAVPDQVQPLRRRALPRTPRAAPSLLPCAPTRWDSGKACTRQPMSRSSRRRNTIDSWPLSHNPWT